MRVLLWLFDVSVLPALGTDAPKDDLCLLDDKAVVGGRLQAWSRADSTVDIRGRSAASTDNVMVVVANPRLIAARVARRLDASHKPRVLQDAKIVVYCLSGKRPQLLADGVRDGFRIPMLSFAKDSSQDGKPLRSHAQTCLANRLAKFVCV